MKFTLYFFVYDRNHNAEFIYDVSLITIEGFCYKNYLSMGHNYIIKIYSL